MKNVDWYTKFILTVIAALLLGILIKPSIIPQEAEADPGERVYVENNYRNPIPVEIRNSSIEVYGEVEVSNSSEYPLYIDGIVDVVGTVDVENPTGTFGGTNALRVRIVD